MLSLPWQGRELPGKAMGGSEGSGVRQELLLEF